MLPPGRRRVARPRQAGKTTLALRVAETRASIHLDLESTQDRAKLTDPELYFAQHSDELIVLDEIHRPQSICCVNQARRWLAASSMWTWVHSIRSRSTRVPRHRNGCGCEEDFRTAISLRRTKMLPTAAELDPNEVLWSSVLVIPALNRLEQARFCFPLLLAHSEKDVRRLLRYGALSARGGRGSHRPRRDGAGAGAVASPVMNDK